MARNKLTPLSKIIIVAVVIGGLYFGITKVMNNPNWMESITSSSSDDEEETTDAETKDGYKDIINVGVVTWGGYAGGEYFNEGFDASTKSRFYKDYGFQVKFKVLDDFDASREAFKNDKIDLMWA